MRYNETNNLARSCYPKEQQCIHPTFVKTDRPILTEGAMPVAAKNQGSRKSSMKLQFSRTKGKPQVQFSETVAMHTYHEEAYNKSYNKQDIFAFKTQILSSATLIHVKLRKASMEYNIECANTNTKLFMISPSLLERINIVPEEMLGIEHLINDAKPAIAITEQRDDMMVAILGEQRFQRIMWNFDTMKIAHISESYSKHAAKRAWRKAKFVESINCRN